MKLKPLKQIPFEHKKDVQNLVEDNLKVIFKLDKIESDFQIERYKLDTLCFNQNSNSFTAVEYKNKNEFAVIDQATAYLKKMQKRKTDLVSAYNKLMSNRIYDGQVNWNNLSILFLAPKFNIYQKDNASENIQLCEFQKYENSTINFDIYSNENEGIIQYKKIFKFIEEDYETQYEKCINSIEFNPTTELAIQLKESLCSTFNYIKYIQKASYVSAKVFNKGLCYIRDKRKPGPQVNIERGYIIDGKKSKNFFTIKNNPNNIAKPDNWVHNDGRRGYRYKIYINSIEDIEPTNKILQEKAETLRN